MNKISKTILTAYAASLLLVTLEQENFCDLGILTFLYSFNGRVINTLLLLSATILPVLVLIYSFLHIIENKNPQIAFYYFAFVCCLVELLAVFQYLYLWE
jgi:heme/copper-type cytochrome/quinol oxidase subunit 4